MFGHLKGPMGVFWSLPTLAVGRGSRGGKALPLPLPPGWVGEVAGTHVPGFPGSLPNKF